MFCIALIWIKCLRECELCGVLVWTGWYLKEYSSNVTVFKIVAAYFKAVTWLYKHYISTTDYLFHCTIFVGFFCLDRCLTCTHHYRVAVNPRTSCDMCDYCQRGQPQFCKIEGTSTAIGINRNGGWAQFCRLQARHVFPLPHQMSLEQGLFLEPFSSIVHGWEQLTPISPDAEILVCGCGATGLLWMCLLYFRGFREVVATEIKKGRTRVAQKLEFGYQIVHPDILVSEARNAENEGDTEWGFDVVIDCTGDATAIGQAFRWLRPGGKLLSFKNCPPESQITINPQELQTKELQILASYGNPFSFTRAVQLVQDMGSQFLNYEKLGIRTFQLQEYHAAIECLRNGEITKAVIEN